MRSGDEPDAREIVAALKGKWHGGYGTCRCPAHDDSSPSLSVTAKHGGIVLVHCHAGCDGKDVIRALRDRGLWPDREERAHPSYHQTVDMPLKPEQPDEAELRRMKFARYVWDGSVPIGGTIAETYLRRARYIGCWLPPTLRFNPRLQHTVETSYHPCIVAAVQDGLGHVTGIQRIYLRPDGEHKANLSPAKAGLGPMRDGAVRLGRKGPLMGIAEGIETALSAAERFSLPVWASLGAGRLKSLWLPEECTQVVIFADNGDIGLKRAEEAVEAYQRQGLDAFIEAPPEEFKDWNDVARNVRSAA